MISPRNSRLNLKPKAGALSQKSDRFLAPQNNMALPQQSCVKSLHPDGPVKMVVMTTAVNCPALTEKTNEQKVLTHTA